MQFGGDEDGAHGGWQDEDEDEEDEDDGSAPQCAQQ